MEASLLKAKRTDHYWLVRLAFREVVYSTKTEEDPLGRIGRPPDRCGL